MWKLGQEAPAHLKLVFDDLPLFVLQLQEEAVLLKAPQLLPLSAVLRKLQQGSDLCAGLEAGDVPLRQMFCDFEPAGPERRRSGQKGSEVGGVKSRGTCFCRRRSAARSALGTDSLLASASPLPAGSAQT